ncbi:MAG: N-acetylmuramoyl-L-alanine amidase, partial [Clostridiales bacterium]|nr:N-acetylmuramoyl-L-alanine amidase [Clostridiales bacterium]
MRFFYRHRIVFGFICIVLALAVTFGICFFALGVTAGKSLRLTVVIDAGHGGVDGGVVGTTSGVKESDINLAVSRMLQTKFEEAGFRVVQTRSTEAGLYGSATSGYKKRDMKKRAQIITESNPVLVLSVHQNFFSLSSRRGAQVFFREDNEQSFTLACMIQTSLNSMPECVKQTSPLKGDYYILNCNDYPTVIVECGFLSNTEDEALLLSEE